MGILRTMLKKDYVFGKMSQNEDEKAPSELFPRRLDGVHETCPGKRMHCGKKNNRANYS